MPFYRMIIHGHGKFNLGQDEEGAHHHADGFFATRWCRAGSQLLAAERGMALLRKEWTSGVSAHMDPNRTLTMEIDKIWRIGLFDIRRAPNRGHSFYSEPDEEDKSADISFWVQE